VKTHSEFAFTLPHRIQSALFKKAEHRLVIFLKNKKYIFEKTLDKNKMLCYNIVVSKKLMIWVWRSW